MVNWCRLKMLSTAPQSDTMTPVKPRSRRSVPRSSSGLAHAGLPLTALYEHMTDSTRASWTHARNAGA